MNESSWESIESIITRTESEDNDSVFFSSEEDFGSEEDPNASSEHQSEPKEFERLLRHPSMMGSFDPDILYNPQALDLNAWDEIPCTNQFRVRSKSYMENQEKIPSHPHSLFRLIAVDLLEVEEPIYSGVCTLPHERVQQWLRRQASNNNKQSSGEGDLSVQTPEFILCINICVPGPPVLHLVMYYAVEDASMIGMPNAASNPAVQEADISPFTRLATKFFFGPSDDFRDRTFKLVPRIIEGNIMVKKAVGSKPTIIGKRIKQYYIRGEKFFEIIIDVSSKKSAAAIIKLARGYVSGSF